MNEIEKYLNETNEKTKIGLTGGIGSGKSVVSSYFQEFGIDIIDADVIAKKLVKPETDILREIVKKAVNLSSLFHCLFKYFCLKIWFSTIVGMLHKNSFSAFLASNLCLPRSFPLFDNISLPQYMQHNFLITMFSNAKVIRR